MRAYMEITDLCNRHCSFCAGTKRPKEFLSPEKFEERLLQVLPAADQIFLHLLGEPLLHPQFDRIAEICRRHDAEITLVTNGTLLAGKESLLARNPAFRQINFSLHALEQGSEEDNSFLNTILSFCENMLKVRPEMFLNLRLWNLSGKTNEKNRWLLRAVGERFPLPPEENLLFSPGRKSRHLTGRLYLNMDTVFEWPSAGTSSPEERGYCHGMCDQFGVLVDGRVVPCCLDSEGAVTLGNMDQEKLSDILSSPRAEAIRNGFLRGFVAEEFCRRCSFRKRFQKR